MIECIPHNLQMKLRVTKESWLKPILRRHTARVPIPALPIMSCMILVKLFNISVFL